MIHTGQHCHLLVHQFVCVRRRDHDQLTRDRANPLLDGPGLVDIVGSACPDLGGVAVDNRALGIVQAEAYRASQYVICVDFRLVRLTHVCEEDVVVVRDVPVLGRESGVAILDRELHAVSGGYVARLLTSCPGNSKRRKHTRAGIDT